MNSRFLDYILHFLGEPPFQQVEMEGSIPKKLRVSMVVLLWMLAIFFLIMGWLMKDTPESIPAVVLLMLMIMIRLSYIIVKQG